MTNEELDERFTKAIKAFELFLQISLEGLSMKVEALIETLEPEQRNKFENSFKEQKEEYFKVEENQVVFDFYSSKLDNLLKKLF